MEGSDELVLLNRHEAWKGWAKRSLLTSGPVIGSLELQKKTGLFVWSFNSELTVLYLLAPELLITLFVGS